VPGKLEIMNYAKSIEPVTSLKTKSAELIRKMRRSGEPIIITQNGKPTAVLQDVESFQRQRDALLLLKLLAKGDQELRAGKGIAHAAAARQLEDRLRALRRG
jgi:prevent-host-death family protein